MESGKTGCGDVLVGTNVSAHTATIISHIPSRRSKDNTYDSQTTVPISISSPKNQTPSRAHREERRSPYPCQNTPPRPPIQVQGPKPLLLLFMRRLTRRLYILNLVLRSSARKQRVSLRGRRRSRHNCGSISFLGSSQSLTSLWYNKQSNREKERAGKKARKRNLPTTLDVEVQERAAIRTAVGERCKKGNDGKLRGFRLLFR